MKCRNAVVTPDGIMACPEFIGFSSLVQAANKKENTAATGVRVDGAEESAIDEDDSIEARDRKLFQECFDLFDVGRVRGTGTLPMRLGVAIVAALGLEVEDSTAEDGVTFEEFESCIAESEVAPNRMIRTPMLMVWCSSVAPFFPTRPEPLTTCTHTHTNSMRHLHGTYM